MAFKMKGFNPGKGTGMNSAFKSKAVEWVKEKAEDFADKVSNIDLNLNLKGLGKGRSGGKSKSSIGGKGGGKSDTTSKKSPVRVDMPDVVLSPGSESKLHPHSFRSDPVHSSNKPTRKKTSVKRYPRDPNTDPNYNLFDKKRIVEDIRNNPRLRNPEKELTFTSYAPYVDTGIHEVDAQPEGGRIRQTISGLSTDPEKRKKQIHGKMTHKYVEGGRGRRSPVQDDFYTPQQRVTTRSGSLVDFDDAQHHQKGDVLEGPTKIRKVDQGRKHEEKPMVLNYDPINYSDPQFQQADWTDKSDERYIRNPITLKHDPKDHMAGLKYNTGFTPSQYARTGWHKDKWGNVFPWRGKGLKRGAFGSNMSNLLAFTGSGAMIGSPAWSGHKWQNTLRGPRGEKTGKVKMRAQTLPETDPGFGDPRDYWDNPVEGYKEKWKKGQLQKMVKTRAGLNVHGASAAPGGFQINPRQTYRDKSKLKKDGEEHRKVFHPRYRDEHGIVVPAQKEYFVDGIPVETNIFGRPKGQKKQRVPNDPKYWPEEQRKTFFGVPIEGSKKRRYKIDPKTNQPKKRYLKQDPDFDYQVSGEMPREQKDEFLKQRPVYGGSKVYPTPPDEAWDNLGIHDKIKTNEERAMLEEGYRKKKRKKSQPEETIVRSENTGLPVNFDDHYTYQPGRAKIEKKIDTIKKKKTEKKKRRKEKRATKKEERQVKKQNRKQNKATKKENRKNKKRNKK